MIIYQSLPCERKSLGMSTAIRGCASVEERVNSINLSGFRCKTWQARDNYQEIAWPAQGHASGNLHRPRPKNPRGLIGRNRYRAPVIACSILSSGPALKLERLRARAGFGVGALPRKEMQRGTCSLARPIVPQLPVVLPPTFQGQDDLLPQHPITPHLTNPTTLTWTRSFLTPKLG